MNLDLIVGLLVMAVPLIGVGYLMLSKQPGIFRMFVAMVVVGLAYLTATGAASDIGSQVMSRVSGAPAQLTPTEAPAPAVPASPAPAGANP